MNAFEKEPAAQRDDWTRAFDGIAYPISVIAVRRAVMDRGGIDHEVLDVLNRIVEDTDFDSEDRLLAAVREVYAADGLQSPI